MIQKKDFNQEMPVKSSGMGKFFWYITFLLIFPIFIHIGKRNRIIKLENKINESDSSIEIQMTKRKETLVKLLDTVKSAIKFESGTLEKITELRKPINITSTSVKEKAQMLENMDAIQKSINVQFENYPNLKSNESFMNMMSAIKVVEEDIAASRRIYNSNVNIFNTDVQSYPNNVVASSMRKTTKVLFEATPAQLEDVKIEF